jgi:pimeloyl-ACP methyl ester carboxylesterase
MSRSPSTGVFEFGGARLAYRAWGPPEGLPVVALHGLASSAETWDRLGTKLAGAGRRLLALDQRGHGRSSRTGPYSLDRLRDDVVAVLDRLGADRADLVGHSLGGHVATLVALAAPARVRRLVLEDTPQLPREGPEGGPTFRLGPLHYLFALTRLRTFDVRMVKPVLAGLRRVEPAWWANLAQIEARTLVVGGGPSSHVSQDDLTRLAAAIPDCQLLTIADAGHHVHRRRPDEFERAVVPFLGPPTA